MEEHQCISYTVYSQFVKGCVGQPAKCVPCMKTVIWCISIMALQGSVITAGLIIQYKLCNIAKIAILMGIICLFGLCSSIKTMELLSKIGRICQLIITFFCVILWTSGQQLNTVPGATDNNVLMIMCCLAIICACNVYYYNFVSAANGPLIYFYGMIIGTTLGGIITLLLYVYSVNRNVLIGLCITNVVITSWHNVGAEMQDTCYYYFNRYSNLNTYTSIGRAVLITSDENGKRKETREDSQDIQYIKHTYGLLTLPLVLYITTPAIWTLTQMFMPLTNKEQALESILWVCIAGVLVMLGLELVMVYCYKKYFIQCVIITYIITQLLGLILVVMNTSSGLIFILISTVTAGFTCVQTIIRYAQHINRFTMSNLAKMYFIATYMIMALCYIMGACVVYKNTMCTLQNKTISKYLSFFISITGI
ncbi:unknown [Cercopithecine alphaherpesvirus 9]|uniref:Envelope protein UL43 n=1 Tax=Cercopithecine herpesvirus 9 (strain DHV) TaxID=36348 RepID=Q9E200_CHV9D|nr:envelope protein UL43 [Cercopithecine alphaherpesvirus 9]AAG27188.1 unknown [Cercopithecine alphaherpesvirus 9]